MSLIKACERLLFSELGESPLPLPPLWSCPLLFLPLIPTKSGLRISLFGLHLSPLPHSPAPRLSSALQLTLISKQLYSLLENASPLGHSPLPIFLSLPLFKRPPQSVHFSGFSSDLHTPPPRWPLPHTPYGPSATLTIYTFVWIILFKPHNNL